MSASGPESPSIPRRVVDKPQAAAPAPAPAPRVDHVRAAAIAMAEAYGEHLNHHCARCTKAWEKLRAALDAAPPV